MKVFPQFVADPTERKNIWTVWRKDLLSQTGIALFFMGNKIITDPESGKQTIVLADGMDEEFQIAHELGLKLIPIGASGYKAKELFNQIDITNSPLYKKNVRIHRNLWKLYGVTLSLSIIFIIIKGFN